MYITPVFGIVFIVSFFLFLGGNLFAWYKMYKRSLDHAEKCGCCGKGEEKSATDIVVDVAKSVVSTLK